MVKPAWSVDTYKRWTWHHDKNLTVRWPANAGTPLPRPWLPIADDTLWEANPRWNYLEERDDTTFVDTYWYWTRPRDPGLTMRWSVNVGSPLPCLPINDAPVLDVSPRWSYLEEKEETTSALSVDPRGYWMLPRDPSPTMSWTVNVGAPLSPIDADPVLDVNPGWSYLEESDEATSYDTSTRSTRRSLDLTEKCLMCRRMVRFAKPAMFGILMNCEHLFCFKCIHCYMFSWKRRRSCPVCDVESSFVLRSATWETSPDAKRKLYEKFREFTSRIPCKFYDSGNGVCKFGSHCHYKH